MSFDLFYVVHQVNHGGTARPISKTLPRQANYSNGEFDRRSRKLACTISKRGCDSNQYTRAAKGRRTDTAPFQLVPFDRERWMRLNPQRSKRLASTVPLPRCSSHLLPVCPSHSQIGLGESTLGAGHQYHEMATFKLHCILLRRFKSLATGLRTCQQRSITLLIYCFISFRIQKYFLWNVDICNAAFDWD